VTIASDFDEERDQIETDEPAGASVVDEFLERISLSSAADQQSGAAVVLMTIHIAKGLEWPVVFLTGLEDGLFPSLREREGHTEDQQLEEERRLAYVAITRARERLVLSNARTRRVWGEIRLQSPSRFLDDLPPGALAQPVRKTITPRAPAIVDGNWMARPRRAARGSIDDFDQRVPDDEPVYRVGDDVPAPEVFRTGDPVAHASFGIGRVVAISGQGKDTKVVVDFPTAGRKTIFAKFLRASDDGLN